MRNRWLILLLVVFVILILGFLAALRLAPETSPINLLNTNDDSLACLTGSQNHCIVMPSVTALNVNSAELHFPEAFKADYHLVVMPFDREQQLLATTWLPLFQELASENDNIQYWSIAALPELNSAIRLLVIGGISAAISESDVRTQVTLLFLEDQQLFLDALSIDNIESIQSFIMDKEGVVYYRETGEYTTEKEAAFRAALQQLLADS